MLNFQKDVGGWMLKPDCTL